MLSVAEVKFILETNGYVVIDEMDVENGYQLKLQDISITIFNTGTIRTQGKNKELVETIKALFPSSAKKVSNIKQEQSSTSDVCTSAPVQNLENSFRLATSSSYGPSSKLSTPQTNNVFIVHGRDHGPLNSVQLLLHSNGYHPIVLSDEYDGGSTIIEKLERVFHDGSIKAAIVLATPDDVYNNGTIARCRPNVELELGYVMAKLSRQKFIYLKKTVPPTVTFDLPSDVAGVIYTSFDIIKHVESKILKELEAIFSS
jgi:predicted nucleotide-binding protein